MNIKERIKIAYDINQLTLVFGQKYFYQFAKLKKIKDYQKVKSYTYFEDEVEMENFDEEGDYVEVKWTYDDGVYGAYNEVYEYLQIPFDILEKYQTEGDEVVKEFVVKNLEILKERERKIQEEKQNLYEERLHEDRYRQFLELKREFENT